MNYKGAGQMNEIETLNKKIDELEERVAELEEELIEVKFERDDAIEDTETAKVELATVEEWMEDREEFAERCFNGGYEAGENNEPQIKSWLNFKIGERI